MRFALFVLALILTACGSQEPAPTPSKPDTGVEVATLPDVPCAGACGAGTVCESGRCVPADAGVMDATSEDRPTVDATADAGPTVEDRAAVDVPVDVGCATSADCPTGLHASFACTAGRCALRNCLDGWSNCDGDPANGCEVNTVADLSNCGMCGRACPPADPARPSVGPVCAGGVCNRRCVAGFANCDGTLDNGCEALDSTPNCGACGVRCDPSRSCTPVDGGFACR